MELIEVIGVRFRFTPGIGRRVRFIFDDVYIEDTMCSCPSDVRKIGTCAHAIAVLCLVFEFYSTQKRDKIPKPDLGRILPANDDGEDANEYNDDKCDEYPMK